jgi:hypothetical protein
MPPAMNSVFTPAWTALHVPTRTRQQAKVTAYVTTMQHCMAAPVVVQLAVVLRPAACDTAQR